MHLYNEIFDLFESLLQEDFKGLWLSCEPIKASHRSIPRANTPPRLQSQPRHHRQLYHRRSVVLDRR